MRLTELCLALAAVTAITSGCLDPDEPGNLVPKTVVEDPSLPHIAVNETLLHAESFGAPNDPMIMVLHGGPGADYQGVLPLKALADDGYHVVFWDQRGTGLSQRHNADEIDLEVYLRDLELVIEHYSSASEAPLVFIGHSWGAMYTTLFINEYGDLGGRIRGAILSEPGAFTRKQLDAYLERLFGSVDLIGEQLADTAWLSNFMTPSGHARADYLASHNSSVPGEHIKGGAPKIRVGAVVAAKLLDLVLNQDFDWTTNLDSFDAPVLFLRGSLNEAATLEHQQELAASYPNSEVITIADVGHEMIWEKPEDYLVETRNYLQAIGFEGGSL